jgi:flagellar export protein FliJ
LKAFRFALEPVLRWRQAQFRDEENKLRQLIADQTRVREKILELERSRDNALRQSVGPVAMDGAEFQTIAKYLTGSKLLRAKLESAYTDLGQAIARQQTLCLGAQQRVELLESLKTKAHAAWQHGFDLELETLASEAYLAKRIRER